MWFGTTSALPALVCVSSLASTAYAGKAWGSWGGRPVFVKAGQSIQAAIASAQPGTKIIVTPGQYAEQLLITQDGLSLVGLPGAVLVPPPAPVPNFCTDLSGKGDQAGICITGSNVVLLPYVAEHKKVQSVGKRIKGVSVTGFTVKGFSGENIAVVGGENTKIISNTLIDGGVYGGLSDGSINSMFLGNTITSSQLGYISICVDDVSGAVVKDNSVDGTFVGLCVQTNGAMVSNNNVKNVCNGIFIDPEINGAVASGNHVFNTNPACAKESPDGFSGIAAGGSIGAAITGNTVEGISSGDPKNPLGAGIAIFDFPGANGLSLATNNKVTHNTIRNNDVDVFMLTNGTGNVVEGNQCSTSSPPGLCAA